MNKDRMIWSPVAGLAVLFALALVTANPLAPPRVGATGLGPGPVQIPGWTPTPAPQPIYLQGLAREQSPRPNPAVSGIQVQNLDASQPATIALDFYREFGWSAFPAQSQLVGPLQALNVYLPSHQDLGEGWFAARAHGDRRLAAIARTEWVRSGGAAMFGNAQESVHLALPLVLRRYAGQTSVVRVQNTDLGQNAHVMARFYAFGEFTTRLTRSYNIRPGGFVTLDLGDDASFGTVGPSFVGWLLIESATPVAATAQVAYDNGSPAVYAFEAVSIEQAARRLAVPLVRHDFYGTTGISVVSMASDNEVSVSFHGSLGSCIGQTFRQGPVRLGRYAGAVFYQGAVEVPFTGTSPLPRGCAGSAVVEASEQILAIVNDASGDPGRPASAAAYLAGNEYLAVGRAIALPLWRKHHTGRRLTTGVQAMNAGEAAARATLRIVWSDGSAADCGPACTVTIQPGQAHNWYPANLGVNRDGAYGSAFIEADRPLAVIVNDVALAGGQDAAIYNGIVVQR